MTFLNQFAKILGIRKDQAEDALVNDRAAKVVLSRRSFVGVGAALVAGTAFGFYKQREHLPWCDPGYLYARMESADNTCSYGNVAIQRNSSNWIVDKLVVRHTRDIAFPMVERDVGLVSHIAIYDAGGHRVARRPISIALRLLPGVSLTVNDLTYTYDDIDSPRTVLDVKPTFAALPPKVFIAHA